MLIIAADAATAFSLDGHPLCRFLDFAVVLLIQ